VLTQELTPVPTYQYQCTECGEGLEVVQKFTDDALTACPTCEGTLRKIFSAVGIVFKGSGFYRTDSRPSAPSTKPAASGDSPPAGGSSGDSSSKVGSSSGAAASGASSGTSAKSGSTGGSSSPAAA
jgi:putative FmdB family regulatory protein